jgi:hypothetical protein
LSQKQKSDDAIILNLLSESVVNRKAIVKANEAIMQSNKKELVEEKS